MCVHCVYVWKYMSKYSCIHWRVASFEENVEQYSLKKICFLKTNPERLEQNKCEITFLMESNVTATIE